MTLSTAAKKLFTTTDTKNTTACHWDRHCPTELAVVLVVSVVV